ncbi:Tyrosine recombinase XerC [Calycomorphotria hydatis]|uniref:Tyrosine recombinase XerC n=1 Tax=Calycomorphotria hydatis TaxID=2528027 RepID=A0A517TD70_9PLAN|nr:Tyrosine recombinase XerC [Calycomorphotria hydatis]
MTTIRRLVLFVKKRKLISYDPLDGIKLIGPPSKPQPFWSKEQVDEILKQASQVHRPVFQFLWETGLRIGELRHLTWQDIDFAKERIHIRAKEDWTTKTGNERQIPMSSTARQILQNQSQHCRGVFTAQPSRKYPDGDHQISDRRLLESLKRTLTKVRLEGHLHTFRHSFISHAIVKGVPEAIIRSWAGHVDQKTLAHYTHISSSASRDAMRNLSESA